MKNRRRVYAYITHRGRLLVFEHPGAPDAGIQVPAGTVKDGEAPADAVVREAREETGLQRFGAPVLLGSCTHDMREFGVEEWQEAHFYHLSCEEDSPADRWRHDETGGGAHAPIPFELYWAPIPDAVPPLISLNGRMLSELYALLGARATTSALIARFPELAFTSAAGTDVRFVPHRHYGDGAVTHAYAVPFVASGDVLVTRRADGQWTLPGGTVEAGETWPDALRRELREETGARLDAFAPIGAYRCAGDAVTYRVVSRADVTRVASPRDADAGRPSSIAEVRQYPAESAAQLFSGRNHHYAAVYRLCALLRAPSVE